MKKQFLIFIFLGLGISIFAQSAEYKELSGSVTFISTENYYVSFVNTNGIQIGDTLFVLKNERRDLCVTQCVS